MGTDRNARVEKSTRPAEMPAVKTTIVGGRPPGCGKALGEIPRGIEVLVKKAVVDPAFREVLLARRAAAAEEIGLALAPQEAMMLNHVPAAQLEAIIARTKVDPSRWNAFLGKAAGVMLAALGASAVISESDAQISKGERPDMPPTASAPSKPASKPTSEPLSRGMRADTPLSADIAARLAERAEAASRPEALSGPGGGRAGAVSDGAGYGGMRVDRPPASQPASGPTSRPTSLPAPTGIRPDIPPGSAGKGGMRPDVPDQAQPLAPAPNAPAPQVFRGGMKVAGLVVGPVAPPPAPTSQSAQTQPAQAQPPGDQPERPENVMPVAGARAVPMPKPPPRLIGPPTLVDETPPSSQPASGPASKPASAPASQPALSAAEIDSLIKQLDDDSFSVREAAHKKLQAQGSAILPTLREALKNEKLSAEVRSRLETLVKSLVGASQPAPKRPDNIAPRRGMTVIDNTQ